MHIHMFQRWRERRGRGSELENGRGEREEAGRQGGKEGGIGREREREKVDMK